MNSFINKKIAVLGFGVEGESVVKFLLKERPSQIVVYDEKEKNREKHVGYKSQGVTFSFGRFPSLLSFDVIVRSPGIRPDIPVLEEAKKNGKEITTPTNIFFSRAPCPIVGVTGTKGKGTTSTLIYEIMREGRGQEGSVYLGGNIGTPPLEFLEELTCDSLVVLELSSFQLIDCMYSPHIAAILMTTQEHLDWHASLEEYISAKTSIVSFQNTTDYVVMNRNYPYTLEIGEKSPAHKYYVSGGQEVVHGSYVNEHEEIIFSSGVEKEVLFCAKEIRLKGRHNWENVLAAVTVGKILGISTEAIHHTVQSFLGLPHRLEFVTKIEGVNFYNDSFSTTPQTTIAAIQAFEEPKVLILGGSSKKSDFTQLGEIIGKSNIRGIIGIGEEWRHIKLKMQNAKCKIFEGCKNMKEIVETAKRMAKSGDVVLLSPACASFGMFANYKERGEQFRKEVERLKG